jgi:hypothetical protein
VTAAALVVIKNDVNMIPSRAISFAMMTSLFGRYLLISVQLVA